MPGRIGRRPGKVISAESSHKRESGPGRPPEGHSGGGTNRSAEPGRGQLENRNVTINSHLTYTNLTDAAQSKTRRGRRRGSVLGRSSKEVVAERHEEGISLPSTLARKKAPPTKRGQGRVVMCAGGCLGGESQPPARVPQIAYVELVPWSVRSRT